MKLIKNENENNSAVFFNAVVAEFNKLTDTGETAERLDDCSITFVDNATVFIESENEDKNYMVSFYVNDDDDLTFEINKGIDCIRQRHYEYTIDGEFSNSMSAAKELDFIVSLIKL